MNAKEEFDKLFGNMYLSSSETALRVFEHGYKAGATAENEACAKACESIRPSAQEYDQRFYDGCTVCSAVIRERMKND